MGLVESTQADAEEMERQASVEGSALGPYRANVQALSRGIGDLVENTLARGGDLTLRNRPDGGPSAGANWQGNFSFLKEMISAAVVQIGAQ